MAATRRLQKELAEIRGSANKSFRDVQVDESNLLIWQGLIVPEKSPYNKVIYDRGRGSSVLYIWIFQGAFLIDIVFPPEYPFKPPKVSFRTKIYHPNIDEKGQVSFDCSG